MNTSKTLRYRRVLLKLSGEALMGASGYGYDVTTAKRIADDVAAAVSAGAEMAVVVGGGNVFRGLKGAADGMDRATADYMGMLATVMNALAFQNALDQIGVPARGALGYSHADCLRILCSTQGAASPAKRAGGYLRGWNRQSVLHDRHDRCTTCS